MIEYLEGNKHIQNHFIFREFGIDILEDNKTLEDFINNFLENFSRELQDTIFTITLTDLPLTCSSKLTI